MKFDYDVIVIGAGHAGCEAAVAAAHMGVDTLLITSDMNRIAQMSCNPAVGGIAKGQIVREIDALGGMMGIVADVTAVQFRMLNRSKGPAVWSPRVQSDRTRFIDTWRQIIDSTDHLTVYQDTVLSISVDKSADKPVVKGVTTGLGVQFSAKTVVLTAGTFLNGLMHFGPVKMEGGRISEAGCNSLTAQLKELGFAVDRMKTGTPMRIDGTSIDMSKVEIQCGDDVVESVEKVMPEPSELAFMKHETANIKRDFHKFSFLPEVQRTLLPRDCYIAHTSPEVHQLLRDNLDSSPLYNGDIKSIGPRYCPSIETKIVTFADKDSHQLFLEPEGETTAEFYINGFSSSLPWEVQMKAISMIPALRNVKIYRPGYAIEYDFFDPRQLTHDLQTKLVEGLYFAGQVNGTTGYEEAAAQGLVAGVNAAAKVKGMHSMTLGRDQAYIGVLIDDLVTKGVDEPYRMFTSRAEYRILLRQDDADMRLTPIGHDMGLASDYRFAQMLSKREQRDALIDFCRNYLVKSTPEINNFLVEKGTSPLTASLRLAELLKRPQINFENIRPLLPALNNRISKLEDARRNEIVEAAEIIIKYEGYIIREREAAEKAKRLEYVHIPSDFDFESVLALSTESRQKLSKIRPASIGQASRIPGVSPADINILLLLLHR
jgi:tRNA uridine 5-carboxymethylaminomethyl modification enzyme